MRVLRGVTAKRLGAIPYPAILSLEEGGFAVLSVGSAKDLVRLIDPIGRIAKEVSLEDAQALSSGELALITRRLGAGVDPNTVGFRCSGRRFCVTDARSPMCCSRRCLCSCSLWRRVSTWR
jgi:subfamily B ATP-binding cassette protein HlyB/CyaB